MLIMEEPEEKAKDEMAPEKDAPAPPAAAKKKSSRKPKAQ
jgi:hypothetical protein